MRHAPTPSPIAAGPLGVSCAPLAAPLVAPPSLALPLPPSLLRAAFVAINLASITITADEHLRTATYA
jgi:hypothetical protein